MCVFLGGQPAPIRRERRRRQEEPADGEEAKRRAS